jgi:serine/threonine protein kinase
VLHSLGIAHKDIKPYNILWINRLQRFVLCDFGTSEPTIQQIGEKTETYLEGTIDYMSTEMIRLREKEPPIGFVDLFYNDIYALSRSIQ